MKTLPMLAASLFVLMLAILLPWLLIWTGEDYLIGLATRVAIYAIAASSLNLILGYGGMISFGHAAYFGVGAYVVGMLSFHAYEETTLLGLPGTDIALVSWLAAIVVSALFALVLGALSLRTSGAYFIMITLAFAQMLYFLFVSLQAYGGDDGLMMFNGRSSLLGLDLSDDLVFYYVCLAMLTAVLIFLAVLVRSRFGMTLQACRQNESRMQALGCSVTRYKLAAFVLAGAIAGLGGALSVNQTEFVSPDLLHWTHSGDLMIMVILGGIGTLLGPAIGAAAFLALEEFLPMLFDVTGLAEYKEHWRIVFGPLLILIVLFARQGLIGLLTGMFTRGRDTQ